MQPNLPSFAVFIPVGPSEADVDALQDLLESLAAHESAPCSILIVDDSRTRRDLTRNLSLPPHWSIELRAASKPPLGRRRYRSLTSHTLEALRWFSELSAPPQFLLKLDTDALIIKPFADNLSRLLADDPAAGVVGSRPKDDEGKVVVRSDIVEDVLWPKIEKSSLRARLIGLATLVKNSVYRSRQHRLIADAVKAGYVKGEHCQGGAYAVSTECIAAMAQLGLLARSHIWGYTRFGWHEDMVVSLYCRLAGFQVRAGDTNVICSTWRGLARPMAEYASTDVGVIHSLKNDKRATEAEIRAFFRQQRAGKGPTRGSRRASR
jgi:hypothetical protein